MDPVAKMLRGQHARALLDDSGQCQILDANDAFADLLQCQLRDVVGCSLKILYCQGTNCGLLEDTLSKVKDGCESSCGVILTEDEILLHVWCMFVLHSTHGKCKLIVLKPMAPPKEPRGVDYVAAAVSSLAPFHMVDVSVSWTQLFGYNPEEMKGRSLKILQGPRTNAREFQDFVANIKQCIPAECTLVAYRKDGANGVVRFRLSPFEISKGKVAVMLQATQLSTLSDEGTTRMTPAASNLKATNPREDDSTLPPSSSSSSNTSAAPDPTATRIWEVTFPPSELAELKADLRNELSRLSFRLCRSIIDAQGSDADAAEPRADRRAAMEAALIARGADVVVKALRTHCDGNGDKLALCAALIKSDELRRVRAWKQPQLAALVSEVWLRALPTLAAAGRN